MLDPVALDKLIRDSGISFRENAQSFVFTCPRCAKKDKLAMYKETGRFVCYHCQGDGYKGRPEFALHDLLGLPFNVLRQKLYGSEVPANFGLIQLELADPWGENEDFAPVANEAMPHEVMWPPDYVGMESPEAFVKGARYLHKRGITAEHVRTYDIRFSPVDQRVVFPVKVDGKLIGWQARYIHGTKIFDEESGKVRNIPKILTSDSLRPGGRFLMFQDRLKGSPHCVLAEGPVTAIKCHLCGGNVASMGKDVTPQQLDVIRRSGARSLYLALDADAGEAITRLVHDLYDDMTVYVMSPPQNHEWYDDPANEKDLGDFGDSEVYEIFRSAKPEPRGRLFISVGGVLGF